MKKNGGAAVARQRGVDIASGEFIGFVDPDDYVEIDFYEKLYSLAVSEAADIAKGSVITVEIDGVEHKQSSELNDVISQNKFKFFGQNLWDAIYRTQMIKEHCIYFEIDIFCFGLQAAYWANKIAVRNDAFYRYVRREDSCDSKYFSVHKWKHWNIRGANFYMTLLNKFDYLPETYIDIVQNFVYPLYFYGYNRLRHADQKVSIPYLANTLAEFGRNLKYRQKFIGLFGNYSNAILKGDIKKISTILRLSNIRPKFISKILCKLIK